MVGPSYDLIVIGAGTAGYAGACTAQQSGLRVAVIEGGPQLGGLCILHGCMPGKTLAYTADLLQQTSLFPESGLPRYEAIPTPAPIVRRKNRLIREFAEARVVELKDGRFDFIRGHVRFLSPHQIEASSSPKKRIHLSASTFLIATGSSVHEIPVPGLKETGYWTSDDYLDRPLRPSSLAILGAGPVAVEAAHYYCSLGTRVTIIQRSPQILSKMDEDLAQSLENSMKSRGVTFIKKSEVLQVQKSGRSKEVLVRRMNRRLTVRSEEILYAWGRKPHWEDLNVAAAQVETEGEHIKVDLSQRTSQSHIFAAGDACGPFMLLHLASRQGSVAGRNAALFLKNPQAAPEKMNYDQKMFALFSYPQLAAVGFSEKDLQRSGIPHLVTRADFSNNGKAQVIHQTAGFAKLIFCPETQRILGAGLVGPLATELIHLPATALYFHATLQNLANLPWYHPTLHEIWSATVDNAQACCSQK